MTVMVEIDAGRARDDREGGGRGVDERELQRGCDVTVQDGDW